MMPKDLWAPGAEKEELSCLCASSLSLLRAHVWWLLQTKRAQLQQLKPMLHRFKTKNHLSGAQEPLYHWMEHFCSWVEHVLFCHIICKSRVMLQDFYLQPFFSCWVFDKVNENPSRLAELQSITSRAFFHFQPSVAFDINLGSWTT